MCEMCDFQKKALDRNQEAVPLYVTAMPGTCGGLVVSGLSWAGSYGVAGIVKRLEAIDKRATNMRATIMTTTLLTPEREDIKDIRSALTQNGWELGTEYSTKYGPSRKGSMEMWYKTFEYRT